MSHCKGLITARPWVLIFLLALMVSGCLGTGVQMTSRILPPQDVMDNEALVTVFLELKNDKGGEAWLKLSSVELVSDQRVVPLAGGQVTLAAAEIKGGQRFIARGPVLAERYSFLRLTIENAALLRNKEKIALRVAQPVVDLPLTGGFQPQAGESKTIIISWDDQASLAREALFSAEMVVLPARLPLLADLAYVSCPEIDTLYLLSTDRNKVSGSLAIKGRPSSMVYSTLRKRLYVLAAKKSSISVVETATNRIVDQFNIPMTVEPSYFIGSPDARWGYILDRGANYLFRIDLNRGSLNNRIRLGYQPRFLLWYEDGHQLLLSSGLDQKVYFLDPESLDTKDTLLVGSGPDGLLVDDNYLYVAEKGANSIGIFDLDSRQAVKRVNVGFAPRRLLKKHNTLYVANYRSNSVSLVLMQQQRVARTIPVGRGPLEMTASDRSKWLYVAAQESGVVSVIDQTSNRLNTTIELGTMPGDVLVVD